jgi:NAD(P)-dependent dehydrogenase (short-subunit alcohol dehydrogenase family)
MPHRLTGEIAIIVGSTSGIGFGLARSLAAAARTSVHEADSHTQTPTMKKE